MHFADRVRGRGSPVKVGDDQLQMNGMDADEEIWTGMEGINRIGVNGIIATS